jgi:uncharacterized membrane-anchored protein YjiN (DUF445 family)
MQELQQRAQLTRMRGIATALLGVMAVLFVGARLLQPRWPAMSYVVAFSEAAMVGALADWFAVTALFRHPFGLPIPHTAIIPANKDRIGASLANFLEHNFMTHNVMAEELRNVDFAGAAATWLSRADNSRAVVGHVVGAIPSLLQMMEDEDISRFVAARVGGALEGIRFAPLLADLLGILVADQRHQVLFDRLIDIVARGLEQHKDLIRKKIHEKSPRWIPRTLDEKFFVRLLEELQIVLAEMKSPDSEWRARFQEATADWIVRLKTSPEIEEKISASVQDMLTHSLFRQYIDQVWADVRARLLADVQQEDSRIAAALEHALLAFCRALEKDRPVQRKLNDAIGAFVVRSVVAQRGVIAGLVERVIRKWDGDTVARKFELYVGSDLQYIRINGTLVGGMVGVLLHLVSLGLPMVWT